MGKPNSTTPELSASYLGRLYLLGRTLPYLRGIWWYDFQDDGWNSEYNEDNFGIVRPDLTAKPAYYVMSDVSQLVAHGQFLDRVETADAAFWALRFRLDGEEIWAMWSADDQPRQVLLETKQPQDSLMAVQLGHPATMREWGFRAWVRGPGAERKDNQLSLVVGHRPWLLRGGMDQVRVTTVSQELGEAGR